MEERGKFVVLIGAGALLGSLTTITLLKLLPRKAGYQSTRKGIESNGKKCISDTTAEGFNLPRDNNLGMVSLDMLKDETVSEHLTRNIQFFGLDSQQKVTASYVVVIGLGGVGSHAASMLLRSGVGRLLLVDFDQVSLSSLNRHAVATREDVGTSKAQCLKKHFSSIFPESHVYAKVLLDDASSEEEILSGHPYFVLDCIDNIDTKVSLLAACVHRGLRVLSATGAGARADPTRIRVADLRESNNDPLSRAVDIKEVMYIAKELWHGRSARDQSIKDVGCGMWRSVNDLMLVRWDRAKPASVSNLILLRFKEADEHELMMLEDVEEKEADFFMRVTSVLQRAELDFGL